MRDDVFLCVQHDYEKSRARHDQEEKLIITAWYNMVRVTHTQKQAFHNRLVEKLTFYV